MLVAALKFRFNYCEKRDFDFSRLKKESQHKREHRCLTKEELAELDEKSKRYPLYRLGWHMMLDLAARVQDLLQFQYNSFREDTKGGGTIRW